MATQTMGQLYTGSGFGKRWNRAWATACEVVFGSINDVSIDKLPQDLFDQLLAAAFWHAADSLGGVPERVEDLCTVPDRPTKPWNEVSLDLAKWRVNQGV